MEKESDHRLRALEAAITQIENQFGRARLNVQGPAPERGRAYWLDLFTVKTWQEFLAAGGEVTGFPAKSWEVSSIRPGDYLLCYLTRVSRFVGVLEATSTQYWEASPIWEGATYPKRVKVKLIVQLTPETAVSVHELRPQLSVFKKLRSQSAWSGAFRRSPRRWTEADGEAVLAALRQAQANPITSPIEQSRRRTVTSTEGDEDAEQPRMPREHTEIQWLLAKLGSDLGLDVWVASNDRNREWNGNKFTSLPGLRTRLPSQFDWNVTRRIQLIDVLWLKANAYVAAFEVEASTQIYSGLLRMADLIAMVPNLNIPLYIVAPDARRYKVFEEVTRPAFHYRSPPLAHVCRYLSFSVLRAHVERSAPYIKSMTPDFLGQISEECERV